MAYHEGQSEGERECGGRKYPHTQTLCAKGVSNSHPISGTKGLSECDLLYTLTLKLTPDFRLKPCMQKEYQTAFY